MSMGRAVLSCVRWSLAVTLPVSLHVTVLVTLSACSAKLVFLPDNCTKVHTTHPRLSFAYPWACRQAGGRSKTAVFLWHTQAIFEALLRRTTRQCWLTYILLANTYEITQRYAMTSMSGVVENRSCCLELSGAQSRRDESDDCTVTYLTSSYLTL